ncbi:MAG: N-acetylmuramoyl-L-alanine amidase, partial [Deltaproteobacteria bacterium]|nr:N-acetylmuramoyl-L-alanine amidase [Deltaproteobacteria bacterium]
MLALLALAPVMAAPAVPPPHVLGEWSAPLETSGACSRVTMIVESTGPARVDVLDGDQWREAPATWTGPGVSVHALDLAAPRAAIAYREREGRVSRLEWDCFVPSGGEARRSSSAPPPAPGVLPAELVAIGVVSRASWGADATQCSTTEDDWYRMAIHHTAGSQTYGGTVQGAVQALQAYSFSTGEYCDIPYQFLVGYDGSLWEGRPYDYYSGATGGGNNDGNIAVCFLGCYHPSGCSTSHSVTEEMIDGGQLLVQTLAGLHAIPSDDDSIRGHRDWPDNATACPGDWLYDRLDDLREPLGPTWAAELVSIACTPGDEAQVSLTTGETSSCVMAFQNAGSATWTPGSTKLAPIPRDEASPLAASTWLDAARMATVSESTAPGGTGYFAFDVYAAAAGEYELDVGLLEEWVAWFADDGGPPDGQVEVFVHVTDPGDGGRAGDDSAAGEPNPGNAVALDEIEGGCGCSGAAGRAGW